MTSGRNVCSVPRFDVATGQMGEARRTAMAHVKSAIETDASSSLLFLSVAFRGKKERGMAVAIVLLLVAVGSVLFHIYSPWWWTPIATNWSYIDHTISITFWITVAVFFAVIAFMAYCVFRFHHKEGRRAAYNPENKKLEWWLTIGTAIGVAAMLAPGLFVWHQFVTVPADATEIEVMGQQWQWSFRLACKGGTR